MVPDFLSRWTHKSGRYGAVYPILYMGMIAFLSSIPAHTTDTHAGIVFEWVSPDVQNTLHIPLYGVLAFLWCRCLRGWGLIGWPSLAGAFVVTLGYGIFDEWYQSFVPGRLASISDVTLNSLGALLGVLGYLYLAGTAEKVE